MRSVKVLVRVWPMATCLATQSALVLGWALD
jgi:hypothetical protein